MSRDYVIRLYFADGTHEQLKYENGQQAEEAYIAIMNHVKGGTNIGELMLPDGTKFAFRVCNLSHWKVFRYTASDRH